MIGLWLEIVYIRILDLKKSYNNKSFLTKNMSIMVVICLGPNVLLDQVNFPFIYLISIRSHSIIEILHISPKRSPYYIPSPFLVIIENYIEVPCNNVNDW